jgi:probable F420-dependent oxidoreductase
VKVRIAIGLGDSEIDAGALSALVGDLEDLGFDSLWTSEVLTGTGPDPLVTLASAAQMGRRLKLGTTMILPGRNEVRLAKSLATLDRFSNGRLLLTFVPGLAHGAERDAVGVPVRDRATDIERTIPRLRRWWAGEDVDGIRVSPRPIQDPLEVWLGGLAPSSLARCGRIADGWLGAACTPEEARTAKSLIDHAASGARRQIDPEHFGVSIVTAARPLGDAQLSALATRTAGRDVDPRTLVPVGYAAVRQQLEAFLGVGMSKFVLRPMSVEGPWREYLEGLADAVAGLPT